MMRTLLLFFLILSHWVQAQERIDMIFEGLTDSKEFRVTTDHGEMKGAVQLEYNANGDPLLHRVTVVSDNYAALAETCSKLVHRQLDLGSDFVEGEQLPKKRYLFLIESHNGFRIVMKDGRYYWTLKGVVVPEKSEGGVVEYQLTVEGEDWDRRDE